MPVQRVLFGRPVTLQLPPRRFIIVFGLAVSIIVLLILAVPSKVEFPAVPTVAELSETAHGAAHHAAEMMHKPKLPQSWNPFAPGAHEPPEQANSTHGETRWYSDWNWLNPFSSLVTLDEHRAVLPNLPQRTPIYTYYDGSNTKDRKIKDAENELILTWRRAWWAQGFRPVVLSRPDAMQNPLYERLQQHNFDPNVERELIRWLAWGHMSGGILANWLALPMAVYDDNLLKFLRRGEFRKLTRYKSLGSALFCGNKEQVNAALGKTFDGGERDTAGGLFDIPSKDLFDVDSKAHSIAYYDMVTLRSRYKRVAEKLSKSRAAGLHDLKLLINSHLQNTWQSPFSDGIAVLKPRPKHMTTLTSRATNVGKTLQQCLDSPAPKSCPPNRGNCRPCDPSSPMPLKYPDTFINKTSSFTVGTVPHPITFNTAQHFRETLDVSFMRRNTLRDQWLEHMTQDLLGGSLSGPQRLVRFKEAVASEYGRWHSLWLTAEKDEPLELDWIFGFAMPQLKPEVEKPVKETPKKGDDSDSERPDIDGILSGEVDLTREKVLMEHAHKIIDSKGKKDKATKAMVEAWDLADTEAWRFVRALGMRRKVERKQFEEHEKRFAGAEKGGRWFDSKEPNAVSAEMRSS